MSFRQRTGTALILLGLLVVVVQWAPRVVFFLFLQLIILAALVEFYNLARRRRLAAQPWLGVVLAVVISLSFYSPEKLPFALALVVALILMAAYFLFATKSIEKIVIFPSAAAITFLGPLYISFPLNFFFWLRSDYRPAIIYFLLAVIFLGDTGAYLIGQKWGRHPLASLASPKKTVEGAVAGLVWAAAGAFLARWLLWPELSPVAAASLGLLTHAAAQLADPFESLFKRAAGVKDSSNLLPGHGGFLDRVDSLLLATPVYYYLLKLFL